MQLAYLIAACCVSVVAARYNQEVMTGDWTRIYTSNSGTEQNYKNHILQVIRANWASFQVKACSDAHIILANSRSKIDTDTEVYEVVIGSFSNSQSVIRETRLGESIVRVQTQGILNCGEYRTFWIHWSSSYIEVGTGPTEHEAPFMRLERDRVERQFDINYMGIATGWGYTGAWQVMENTGSKWIIKTEDSTPMEFYSVTKSVTQRHGFFTFELKACAEGHIALDENARDTNGAWKYHLTLGAYENTKVCFQMWNEEIKCNDSMNGVATLDCDVSQEFWISWAEGNIAVGKGAIYGVEQMYSYYDASFTSVGVLSFQTGWHGYDGEWTFPDSKENHYSLLFNPEQRPHMYNYWALTPRVDFVTVVVKACQDAWIAIAAKDFAGSVSDGSIIEVRIGTHSNTRTVILYAKSGETLVDASTPNILVCKEPQPIWISWAHRKLTMGTGSHGGGQLVEADIPTDLTDILAVGFGAPDDQTSGWVVNKDVGDEMYMTTPINGQHSNAWITVEQDIYKVFRIQGCKDAEIALAQYPQRANVRGHGVVIGKDGTWVTVYNLENGQEVGAAEVSDVLSCTEMRTFWVSWHKSHIQVGRGYRMGEQMLVRVEEQINHEVNALSLASNGDEISWEFENDVGDWFMLTAPGQDLSMKWLYCHPYNEWIYFMLEADVGARLVLTENYQDTKNAYYFYIGDEKGTQTTLYRGSSKVANEITPNVLGSNDLRSFWVSWRHGHIRLGTSKYYAQNTLVEYRDGKPFNIRAAAITGLYGKAKFKFYESEGSREFTYDTGAQEDWDQAWVSVRRRTHMMVAVKACMNVQILFGTIMFNTEFMNNYLVTIDSNANATTIEGPYKSNHGDRTVYASTYSKDTVSCTEERIFWLSWQSGHIAVGRGNVLGRSVLLSHHDLDPIPIKAISFSTAGVTGQFRYTFSASGFVEVPPSSSSKLSGGEVTAAVFGFIALFALFGGALYILFRPPEALQPYILPQKPVNETSMQHVTGGGATGFGSTAAAAEPPIAPQSSGLDNPMYADVKIDFDEE